MEQILITLVTGALGGTAIGKTLKSLDLGMIGNIVGGAVGGGLGGQILAMTGSVGAEGVADVAPMLIQAISGGAGGGALVGVLGLLKSILKK